jgi:hypothetical protein
MAEQKREERSRSQAGYVGTISCHLRALWLIEKSILLGHSAPGNTNTLFSRDGRKLALLSISGVEDIWFDPFTCIISVNLHNSPST